MPASFCHAPPFRGRVWPALENFSSGRYLEVGWGDRDYYQALDPHMGLALKAALLPTASVLHIIGFNASVTACFPHAEIIAIPLSPAGLEQMLQAIAESFAREEAGRIRPLGPGLYGNGRFYLSSETYHLFNTCNVWTARALHAAGLPLWPAGAIRVSGLMSQVREHGMTIQEASQALQ